MSIVKQLEIEEEVNTAKENGCIVAHLKLKDQHFVYRSLNRMEWKVIQKDTIKKASSAPEGDTARSLEIKDETEEIVVIKSCMYPRFSDASDLTRYPAGWVSQLAEKITELSGFGELEAEPTIL